MNRSSGDAGAQRGRSGPFRGVIVAGGFLGLAALLAAIGLKADAPLALRALILLSEPVSSLVQEAFAPWTSVMIGLAVNAFALGYMAHSIARFGSRMNGMVLLAERVLNRRGG